MSSKPDSPMHDSHVITFGKFKGQQLKDVPSRYLDWLIGQKWFIEYGQLYNYILSNLNSIQEDLEEEN